MGVRGGAAPGPASQGLAGGSEPAGGLLADRVLPVWRGPHTSHPTRTVQPLPHPGGRPPDTPRCPRDAPLSRALSAGRGPHRCAREHPPLDPPGRPRGPDGLPSRKPAKRRRSYPVSTWLSGEPTGTSPRQLRERSRWSRSLLAALANGTRWYLPPQSSESSPFRGRCRRSRRRGPHHTSTRPRSAAHPESSPFRGRCRRSRRRGTHYQSPDSNSPAASAKRIGDAAVVIAQPAKGAPPHVHSPQEGPTPRVLPLQGEVPAQPAEGAPLPVTQLEQSSREREAHRRRRGSHRAAGEGGPTTRPLAPDQPHTRRPTRTDQPLPHPGGRPPDTPRGPRDAPLSRALSAGRGPHRCARERPPLDPPGRPCGPDGLPSRKPAKRRRSHPVSTWLSGEPTGTSPRQLRERSHWSRSLLAALANGTRWFAPTTPESRVLPLQGEVPAQPAKGAPPHVHSPQISRSPRVLPLQGEVPAQPAEGAPLPVTRLEQSSRERKAHRRRRGSHRAAGGGGPTTSHPTRTVQPRARSASETPR